MTVSGTALKFEYVGKWRKKHSKTVRDPEVAKIVATLKRLEGDELFKFLSGDRIIDVKDRHVNDYIQSIVGEDFTAKDFRTWAGTLLCSITLAWQGRARARRNGSARSAKRSSRRPSSWEIRPPSAARPTSVPACSTSTWKASRSRCSARRAAEVPSSAPGDRSRRRLSSSSCARPSRTADDIRAPLETCRRLTTLQVCAQNKIEQSRVGGQAILPVERARMGRRIRIVRGRALTRMTRDDPIERFSRNEPFFSVLTASQYLAANLTPRTRAEFFDSGEAYVADLIDFVRSRVDQHFTAESVLEFGCGPGRLAIPFARRVKRVVAVDTSPAMLDTALRSAEEFGTTNIEFTDHRAIRFLPGAVPDLVNCHLVLQRLPKTEGLRLIETLLQRVGEIGVFHLPYADRSSRLARLTRAIRSRSRFANAIANLLRHKPAFTPLIPSTVYNLSEVLTLFESAGYESIQVTTARHELLDTATLVVRRRRTLAPLWKHSPRVGSGSPCAGASHIDVRELLRDVSLEEWNRRAEAYFASLTDWQHHISNHSARSLKLRRCSSMSQCSYRGYAWLPVLPSSSSAPVPVGCRAF